MSEMNPSLILINPWIYDFAAYDLWSKPLGLLTLAGFLRKCGFRVDLIDCMDVHHPNMKYGSSIKAPKRRRFGTGKYIKEKVLKPEPLQGVPRTYSRYGISNEIFEQELRRIKNPSAILITSLMTYWYPGVKEVVDIVKHIHPGVPVILGGIYAILCREHALKNSGAHVVYAGSDPEDLMGILEDYDIFPPDMPEECEVPLYPAFDLLTKIDYVCIQTSRGCPYRCVYCASGILNPVFSMRNPDDVFEEILYWNRKFFVKDFAFYDDALLVSFDTHLAVVLEKLAKQRSDLRFHTPNAMHAGKVTGEIASLMYKSGFKTIRLGLETADFSIRRHIDNKISEGDFERAVSNLLRAGFESEDIGAYILIGLPGQSVGSVIETIDFADRAGAVPYLSEYSPIPHTDLWKTAVENSEYDLEAEPLFHNNTLLSCWDKTQRQELPRLKNHAFEIRNKRRGH